MIVNNKLNGEFRLVKPKTIPIASRSISLNLRSSMGGSVDLSYLYAKARGIDFNMSFIDKDYPDAGHKLFDTAYMRGLYGYGLRAWANRHILAKAPARPGRVTVWPGIGSALGR